MKHTESQAVLRKPQPLLVHDKGTRQGKKNSLRIWNSFNHVARFKAGNKKKKKSLSQI